MDKILIWIIIFVILTTIPFSYNMVVKACSKPQLSFDTPVINKMSRKQCVKPKDEMRENHMKLLNEWRDSVVHNGDREYGIIDGEKYDKSLQKTCLHCHSNKKEFCDRCHNYVNVAPYCWNCHIAPEGK